jgi:uncharacterized membrane protein (DUF4010 family)
MNKRSVVNGLYFGVWAAIALTAWQLLPDRYMGPYSAWNPHAIMEFVIIIFSISVIGKFTIHMLGPHYGLLVTGLVGGFASSTATIYSMGALAKSSPTLADRAALGGVLSNIATLVQLIVLLQLLAPQLLSLFVLPLCVGMASMIVYAVCVIVMSKSTSQPQFKADDAQLFNWKSLLSLTALVCGVSYVSAVLNATYGQDGLFLGAAISGLVDAHAIVPTVVSLMMKNELLQSDALIALLIALSANTLTKCLIALQSGGWVYARKVSLGVGLTTATVWAAYIFC